MCLFVCSQLRDYILCAYAISANIMQTAANTLISFADLQSSPSDNYALVKTFTRWGRGVCGGVAPRGSADARRRRWTGRRSGPCRTWAAGRRLRPRLLFAAVLTGTSLCSRSPGLFLGGWADVATDFCICHHPPWGPRAARPRTLDRSCITGLMLWNVSNLATATRVHGRSARLDKIGAPRIAHRLVR